MEAWFRGLDRFGHPVRIYFNGENSHKTNFGALCSLIIFGFVLSFLALDLTKSLTMSDPDISIQRKHMTSSSIDELLPFRLSEYENYNLGVVLINPMYKVLDLPPGIGKFVEVEYLDGFEERVKDLKSCDGLISDEAFAKSLPFVREIITSGKMKCLPKDTLVTTFLGEHGKNSMVQMQKC